MPFLPLHVTQSSYIHDQTHQPVGWWFTVGCLLAKGKWGHLKATWAPVDVRHALERGLSEKCCHKGCYTYTVVRHTFHHHLLAPSMDQQHMCLILLNIEQSAFHSGLFLKPVWHPWLGKCGYLSRVQFALWTIIRDCLSETCLVRTC